MTDEAKATAPESLPARSIDKGAILLAFDSAISSLLGMRQFLDMLIPDGLEITVPEQTGCRHENRAPSDPTFCLDCEESVGVSSGFTGGAES